MCVCVRERESNPTHLEVSLHHGPLSENAVGVRRTRHGNPSVLRASVRLPDQQGQRERQTLTVADVVHAKLHGSRLTDESAPQFSGNMADSLKMTRVVCP